MTERKDRKIYIDFLKIAAIFMVLFNHTGTNGYFLFLVRHESPLSGLYLFNAVLIKMGVPLFFMASGALLIGKEESLKEVVKNRVLKYLTVLIAASIIQYFYYCFIISPQTAAFSDFLLFLYNGRFVVAYWYLYAYLAFLLMLPLIRRLARAMTDREYLWMAALFGFVNLLTIIDYLIWKEDLVHNSDFSFFIQFPDKSVYLFYSLMGYFIDQRMDDKCFSGKTFFALAISGVFAIAICCWMTVYRCENLGEWVEASSQYFFRTLIFIPSIAFFFGVKLLFIRHKPGTKISRIITALGGTTFGIFLFENIYRDSTYPVFLILEPYIRALPACWIWILVAFTAGAIVTLILKRVPVVKKYI